MKTIREIKEIRRENLRKIANDKGGTSALANVVQKDVSRISQLIGPNPIRNIGEETAREFEGLLALPSGWLDKEHSGSNEKEPDNMIASQPFLPYTQINLLMKYVDMAYGLRHLKQEAYNFIFKEMLEDQKKYILPSDISLLIRDILDDESKLLLAWEILHNLDFAKKIFTIIN